MKFIGIDEIQCKSSQGAQIQPCSLLLARIQGSNFLSDRGSRLSVKVGKALSLESPQIHEIHEIQ